MASVNRLGGVPGHKGVGGKLAGLLLIEDENEAEVIRDLQRDGVKRAIMLTGDSEKTAAGIASLAGITEYRSELLPEDKADVINEQEGVTSVEVNPKTGSLLVRYDPDKKLPKNHCWRRL